MEKKVKNLRDDGPDQGTGGGGEGNGGDFVRQTGHKHSRKKKIGKDPGVDSVVGGGRKGKTVWPPES